MTKKIKPTIRKTRTVRTSPIISPIIAATIPTVPANILSPDRPFRWAAFFEGNNGVPSSMRLLAICSFPFSTYVLVADRHGPVITELFWAYVSVYVIGIIGQAFAGRPPGIPTGAVQNNLGSGDQNNSGNQ